MPYTIDWNSTGTSGSFTSVDGGDTLNYSVNTTTNSAGQTAIATSTGNPPAPGLWVKGLTDTVTTTMTFDDPVSNLSFEIFDIDHRASRWDDALTIIATDANGDQVVVNFSDLDGLHSVSGDTLHADGNSSGGVETSGAADSVTVNIAGPITGLTFVFDHGDAWHRSGMFGVSNMTMEAAALDHIVAGGSGDDLIDGAFLTDPEGDRIDNNDHSDGSNDDSIEANDGNDTVVAGLGDDTVDGGTGNDVLFGDAGDDVLFGDAGNDSLFGGDGSDTLWDGAGSDVFDGGADADTFFDKYNMGDDTVIGGETGVDDDVLVSLGGADSTLDLTAGGTAGDSESGTLTTAADTLTFSEIERVELSSGNDSVIGSDGDDSVATGTGADTVDGGAGNDSFDLGAGDGAADLVRFSDGDGADTVAGFEVPTDLGGGAYGGNDQLDVSDLTDASGNPVNVDDVTVSDTNGDGTGDAILVFPNGESITLTGVPVSAVSSDAQLVAMGIPGASGNYIVEGGAGDDLINTAYVGDPEGDMIDNNDAADGSQDDIVHAGDGDDTIDSGFGDDSILGGSGDEEIFLDNTIQNDTIVGGETGETEGDRINFSTVTDDITITFTGDEEGTLTDGVSTTEFSEIERFQMGTGSDHVTGSGGAEEIIGNYGDDTIIGGAGNDTIYSGYDDDSVLGGTGDDSLVTSSGADTVEGGAGDDQINVGPADGEVDTVVFSDGDGDDTIGAFEAPIDNGDGTFTGQDQVDVSGLTDLMGNPVNTNDVVVSDDGSGNAILTFPNGESMLFSGVAPSEVSDPLALQAMGIPAPASDGIVSGTAAGELIDADYVGDPDGDVIDGFDAELPGHYGDEDSVEAGAGDDTVYSGDADDTVHGGTGNDDLRGQDGDDSLLGEDGDDTIVGGSGDDTMIGGEGSDVFYLSAGSMGNDSIVGGESGTHIDSIEFDSSTTPLTVTFTGDKSGTITDGTHTVAFSEIERIVLPDGADNVTLVGDSTGIEIWAGGDNDTITGGIGDDTILGMDGDDSIDGGAGHDNLDGDAGDDTVEGGAGADTLVGGLGDDSLTGGTGADEIYANEGADTINVAEGDTVHGGDGDDLFLVTDLGEAGANNATITGGEGDETLGDTLDFQGNAHWDDITYTNTDPGVGGGMSGFATLSDGSVVNFSEIENIIICFTAGTKIATSGGARDVADLKPGDMVVTRDNGLQPIRWVGQRTVPALGSLAPIRFESGVLGNGKPLLVSPQHRVLIQGPQASLMFGEGEVLASAKHLTNGGSIVQQAGGEVTYVHIMFDRHEIVYAEGAATESFYPGDTGLDAVEAEAREELFTLFPELRSAPDHYGDTARMCLRSHESRLFRLG